MKASENIIGIVLAAGQGTRMKSDRAKVLWPLAGRPMAAWAVDAVRAAGATRVVVVVGYAHVQVAETLRTVAGDLETAHQAVQRGTGDAVRVAVELLEGATGRVLITYGDCPLVRPEALVALVSAARAATAPVAMLTGTLEDPAGYGRIVRENGGRVVAIREHKDASPAERAIREVNPGVYCVELGFLRHAVAKLAANNAQGELYLTDLVGMSLERGGTIAVPWDMAELRGVNDRFELATAEAVLRLRVARAHALTGVTIRDPATTWIDASVTIGHDAVIEAGVHLRGRTRIGAGVRVDVGCVLEDVEVADGAWLRPYTIATRSRIGHAAQVGPFSHLRPESDLGEHVHVGNFVETKKTRLGRGSKANHLAYLGDGEIGENVNVGAGTILCNYDGFRKNVPVLEDDVFIGSDSQLVAPVRVGKGAYVGSGSTITKDVPPDALAISRVRQQNKEGYASRLRTRLTAAAAKKAKE